MGGWLAKEWKAVSKEDSTQFENPLDISTGTPKPHLTLNPLQDDRLRVLKDDPRSPSGSITRTPIEIVATPDQKRFNMDEFSPAPSPALGDSPGVALIKKKSNGNNDLQRKLFQRNPPPKFQAYENDGGDE